MKSPKPDVPRWVWRISQSAPLGEWVDLNAPAPPPRPRARAADLPEVAIGGWVVSSFDLLRGIEVDASGDTVPDELFDEFFPPKKDGTDSA
ncbi:MAG TPA: hypothetical protein VJO99_08265 [Burkholderiaceae bacterium]|nr:hypothetical protein [Burkholderiaceae bacterium]